jgi:hypothetical protein
LVYVVSNVVCSIFSKKIVKINVGI